MKRYGFLLRVASAAAMACACMVHEAHAQEAACFSGGRAAAEVYVVSNPLYAIVLTDFEQYVAKNASQFSVNGDAIRCLSALSEAFLKTAFQLYDPAEQRRRDAMNTQLESMDIKPDRQSSASSDALMASRRLARLARGLPAAAKGDFGPYQTPLDDLERMQIFAEQMLRSMIQSPEIRSTLTQMRPVLTDYVKLELTVVLRHAAALAEQSCGTVEAPADCGYLEGTRALAKGDIAGAKHGFAQMRSSDPASERWAVSEGVAWYKAGRYVEAEEANRRALKINPRSYSAHDNLAFLLFDLRQPSEALNHWDTALQIRPESADAMAGKAIALRSLGRLAEALDFYRRAVSADDSYLDCAIMREKFFWSPTACEAAAPLIKQLR
jgi:tetratricopeptide (TPR) repeat protein